MGWQISSRISSWFVEGAWETSAPPNPAGGKLRLAVGGAEHHGALGLRHGAVGRSALRAPPRVGGFQRHDSAVGGLRRGGSGPFCFGRRGKKGKIGVGEVIFNRWEIHSAPRSTHCVGFLLPLPCRVVCPMARAGQRAQVTCAATWCCRTRPPRSPGPRSSAACWSPAAPWTSSRR